MREPLVWPGGTRHSASGLLVQIHTDEGLVGVGEAPGPTLPTIQTIIDAELTQFLDRPGSAARRVARAPDGGVHAQLEPDRRVRDRGDRDGPARPQGQGARRPGRGAARRLLPRPRPGRRLPLHRLAGGERAEGRRVRRRRLHRAEAQGRARLRAGSRHDRGDPRPRRARREDPDRREHDLERPGGDQVDQGPRAASTSSTSSSRCRTSTCRAWRRCAAPSRSRSPRTRRAPTCAPCSS